MHIDRIENDKIVEHWGQGDALGLMQLGIVFLPSPALFPHMLKSLLSKLFKKRPGVRQPEAIAHIIHK